MPPAAPSTATLNASASAAKRKRQTNFAAHKENIFPPWRDIRTTGRPVAGPRQPLAYFSSWPFYLPVHLRAHTPEPYLRARFHPDLRLGPAQVSYLPMRRQGRGSGTARQVRRFPAHPAGPFTACRSHRVVATIPSTPSTGGVR